MAYSSVQTSGKLSTSSAAALSWTPGVAPTLNNLLTYRVFGWDSNASTHLNPNAVRDSSGTPKTYTQHVVQERGGTSTGAGASVYSLVVPSGLTSPETEIATGNMTFRTGVFTEWSGNATTSVIDQTNVFSGTGGTIASGTVSSGANAGLALTSLALDTGSGTATITNTGTSFTDNVQETDGTNTECGALASRTSTVASQGSLSDTWTVTGVSVGAVNAVIATFNVPASSQDTPELYGRPDGLRGQRQMHSLLSQ